MVNQTFQVIYQNERFLVDPDLLCSASNKFQNLMNQTEKNGQKYYLKINYSGFTTRNVSNFLKICQNQQTDVQNSELKEICLLAKMFQAEQIFNTALNFIHSEIDSNYFISSNQLIEITRSENLILEPDTKEIVRPFIFDLSDLEFDESLDQIESNIPNDNKKKKEKAHSVCYQIKIKNPIMKCHRFYLIKNGEVLFMAKQKYDKITIGEGKNCHINENKHINAARITRDTRGYNIVTTNDQQFKIRYQKNGEKFSIKTSFDHKSGKQIWEPMEPKNQNLINGEYDHKAIQSRKNLILQNPRKCPAFIVRQMEKKVFEAECHPDCDPVIAFAIALSQIIGPIAI